MLSREKLFFIPSSLRFSRSGDVRNFCSAGFVADMPGSDLELESCRSIRVDSEGSGRLLVDRKGCSEESRERVGGSEAPGGKETARRGEGRGEKEREEEVEEEGTSVMSSSESFEEDIDGSELMSDSSSSSGSTKVSLSLIAFSAFPIAIALAIPGVASIYIFVVKENNTTNKNNIN